jgi:hypothetical protein
LPNISIIIQNAKKESEKFKNEIKLEIENVKQVQLETRLEIAE